MEGLIALRSAPRRIIVCDNGSEDESVPRILEGWAQLARRSGFPGPELLREGQTLPSSPLLLLALAGNPGFSGGNNAALSLAMQDAGCKAFWLLNNDTVPHPDALDALCSRLAEDPGLGLAGSSVYWFDRPDMLQCAAGGSFNRWLGTTRQLAGGLTAPRELPCRAVVEGQLAYVSGASLLVHCSVLETVGLLSEDYFLYYEDVDFSLRARAAGFGLGWAVDSRVLHKGGATTGASSEGSAAIRPVRSPMMDYLSIRNRFHILRHFYPVSLLIAGLSLIGIIFNRLRRGETDRCSLVLRAAWDAICGRMGKPLSFTT